MTRFRLVRHLPLSVLAAAAAGLLGGCAGGATVSPSPGPAPSGRITIPGNTALGIDAYQYPGDAAMRDWKAQSPYSWTGYYLAAPCHRDATWMGRRDALARMGWGIAVVFVGQQDWARPDTAAAPAPAPRDTTAAPAAPKPPPQCSSSLLTEPRGTADADTAMARAAADGFAPGTTVFLDVERVASVSPALETYVRAWLARVLADGRFRPGMYVHAANAQRLYDIAQAAYSARGLAERPRFWIATPAGFSRDRTPADVGFPFADAWQGVIHQSETWGTHPITVDVSVSTPGFPSGGAQ
jgi:hypothetical protein